MPILRSAFLAAAAGGVAVCLTACGGGAPADPLASMSASQIMSKTLTDLKATSSVEYSGTASDSGQAVSIDIVVAKGGNCRGTITEPDSGLMKIVAIGQSVWLQMSPKFWTSQGSMSASQASSLAGKYVQMPDSSADAGGFSQMCSTAGLASGFTGKGALKKEAESTIDGQKVVAIADSANNAVAYVTDTATPELVRVTGSGSAKGNILNFTGYGDKVLITAPSSSEVINGAKLGL
jgi:hypothetical protein